MKTAIRLLFLLVVCVTNTLAAMVNIEAAIYATAPGEFPNSGFMDFVNPPGSFLIGAGDDVTITYFAAGGGLFKATNRYSIWSRDLYIGELLKTEDVGSSFSISNAHVEFMDPVYFNSKHPELGLPFFPASFGQSTIETGGYMGPNGSIHMGTGDGVTFRGMQATFHVDENHGPAKSYTPMFDLKGGPYVVMSVPEYSSTWMMFGGSVMGLILLVGRRLYH